MAAAIATRGGGHRVGVHVCGPDVPGARVSRRSRAGLVWGLMLVVAYFGVGAHGEPTRVAVAASHLGGWMAAALPLPPRAGRSCRLGGRVGLAPAAVSSGVACPRQCGPCGIQSCVLIPQLDARTRLGATHCCAVAQAMARARTPRQRPSAAPQPLPRHRAPRPPPKNAHLAHVANFQNV